MPDRRRKPERPTPPKDKICKTCRRAFSWTEKRAKDWDIAKYCSPQCSGYAEDDKVERARRGEIDLSFGGREAGRRNCGPARLGSPNGAIPGSCAEIGEGRKNRHDPEEQVGRSRTGPRPDPSSISIKPAGDRPPHGHERLLIRMATAKKRTAKRTSAKKSVKRANAKESNRCWPGFEPTPGKRPGMKGSCKPEPRPAQ